MKQAALWLAAIVFVVGGAAMIQWISPTPARVKLFTSSQAARMTDQEFRGRTWLRCFSEHKVTVRCK